MQAVKTIHYSYKSILQEAKSFTPGANDTMALYYLLNHLGAVKKFASERERKIAAAEKMIVAAELFTIFFERRN